MLCEVRSPTHLLVLHEPLELHIHRNGMWGQPQEHNAGGYNKRSNTLSLWGLGLWIKSDCALPCDLWSLEFSPAGPAHSGGEQAPGTLPIDVPPFVTEGFGSRSCTWQATLSALFVVQPVPAGVRLPPRLLSFWAWILSSCVYTNRTHHPQGVPPPDSVFPPLRLHTVIFDRQSEDTARHDGWALGLYS